MEAIVSRGGASGADRDGMELSRDGLLRWVGLRLGAGVLLGGVCGCSEPAPAPVRAGPAQHLLLVVVDTLRADHVGVLGAARDTTPQLDALAERGVVFSQAIAPSPWTRPSMGTLMTGRLPLALGLTDHNFRNPQTDGDVLPQSALTLAEVLGSADFATSGVVANINVEPVFGFDQGFADYVSVPAEMASDPAWRERNDWLRDTSSRVTTRARDWLADFAATNSVDDRAFLYVHYLDPHDPYTPAAKFDALFDADRSSGNPWAEDERLYDAEIRQIDAEVGRLLDGLDDAGIADDTLVVIVSDHGEEFGDHGGTRHGHSVYDELLRVPWIMAGPGVARERRRDQVGLIDVMPTVLDALDIAAPTGLRGTSQLALTPTTRATRSSVSAEHASAAVFSESAYVPLNALRAPPWKLIVDTETNAASLFNLARDPREHDDVAAHHPHVVQRLLERWRDERATSERNRLPSDATSTGLSSAQREQLEALGYIGDDHAR